MLDCDDVIEVVRQLVVILMDQAVLAPSVRASPNKAA
jgi:hypothetical protein